MGRLAHFADFARELLRTWWARVGIALEVIALLGFAGVVSDRPGFAVLALVAVVPIAAVVIDVYRGSLVGEVWSGLGSEDPLSRAEAVERLSRTRGKRAEASLVTLSENRGEKYTIDVQVASALALASRGHSRAAPGLKACLSCDRRFVDQVDAPVRTRCAEAAVHYGHELRDVLLTTVRQDPVSGVRRAALSTFERVAGAGLSPTEVQAVADARAVDPALVAKVLVHGRSDSIFHLVELLSVAKARADAANSLVAIEPPGVDALIDHLARGDLRPSASAVDEFLASCPDVILAALGIVSPPSPARPQDPVIPALAKAGPGIVGRVANLARRPATRLAAVRVLERLGEPALAELVLLLVLQARDERLEWGEGEWRELEEVVQRTVPRDLDLPRDQVGDSAVIEALCWAGRPNRELPTRWLLRLVQKSRRASVSNGMLAWPIIALHLLWAGSERPPPAVGDAVVRTLELAKETDTVGSRAAMDRPFHASWVGAAIRAAAAVGGEDAPVALFEVHQHLEELWRRAPLGFKEPFAEMDEETRAARQRIVDEEPRRTLLRQKGWPWPVDPDPARS